MYAVISRSPCWSESAFFFLYSSIPTCNTLFLRTTSRGDLIPAFIFLSAEGKENTSVYFSEQHVF